MQCCFGSPNFLKDKRKPSFILQYAGLKIFRRIKDAEVLCYAGQNGRLSCKLNIAVRKMRSKEGTVLANLREASSLAKRFEL